MTLVTSLKAGWAATLLVLGGSQGHSQVVQSLDLQLIFAPVVADLAGEKQLVYELHLTNFAMQAVIIERITVVDSDSGRVIGAAEGPQLDGLLGRAGKRGQENIRTIEPGNRTLAYFNLPLVAPLPNKITHRVRFRLAGEPAEAFHTLTAAGTSVSAKSPVVLGPPLRGGPWAAVYAPEMERGHRRVVYATEGAARIPGRFAVDWIKLDAQGNQAPSGVTRLDAFYGYGADVLAVADATVASVRDDVAEPETLDSIPKVSIGEASGNYVTLDLGDGRFAFYEHLQRGIPVRPGQRIKRGDVIGRLGLTGQGSSPHLHFHVANANSLLAAEGLPFVMQGMRTLGGYSSIEAFGRGGLWAPLASAIPATPFAPAPNSVVSFKTIR